MAATATAQDENNGGNTVSALRKNGGFEIVRDDAMPNGNPEGKIVDPQGNTLAPVHPTLMGRLDARTKEEITLSKGTLWLLGATVVIVNLAFLFGGSLLGWAREDQSQKEQLNSVQSQMTETRDDVKELNNKFDQIQKSLQEQALRDARKQGYELKAAEGAHGK